MSIGKKMLMIAALGFSLAGCSKVVNVPLTSYGVKVSGDGHANYEKLFKSENMSLPSTFCMYHCEKGYVYNLAKHTVAYEGLYSIQKSNKLDITIGARLTIEFNRSGGKDEIVKRLQTISSEFQPMVSGTAKENQILSWYVAGLFDFVLPESQYKSIVRKNLSELTISEAYSDLSAIGPIAEKIEKDVKEHLKKSGDLFILTRTEFYKLGLPDEVVSKNTQEYNLDAQERIQKRALVMQRARVKERHLLNLEELENDVELIQLIGPTLSKEVLTYKWQQWANNAVEHGIPVAIDPSMLNPAVNEMSGKAFDYKKFKETIKQRKSDITNEISEQNGCAENIDGCDKE